ncbi:hypothetical protein D3C87_1002680 [compost metagenome]
MPVSSKPMFSMLATIPAAESTISASMVCIPEAVLTETLQPAPLVSTDSTLAEVITSIPVFFKLRNNCFETSSSSTGTTFSINSTMVTFVPIVA